jgi:anti-sigma B factor antagonist
MHWQQPCRKERPISMNLNAEVERIDATTVVVKLTGRMTLGMRLHEVESTVNKLAWDGTRKMILELSGVEYADSAGLGLLMLLYGRMKTVGGQLRLVAPRKQLLDVLRPFLVQIPQPMERILSPRKQPISFTN